MGWQFFLSVPWCDSKVLCRRRFWWEVGGSTHHPLFAVTGFLCCCQGHRLWVSAADREPLTSVSPVLDSVPTQSGSLAVTLLRSWPHRPWVRAYARVRAKFNTEGTPLCRLSFWEPPAYPSQWFNKNTGGRYFRSVCVRQMLCLSVWLSDVNLHYSSNWREVSILGWGNTIRWDVSSYLIRSRAGFQNQVFWLKVPHA